MLKLDPWKTTSDFYNNSALVWEHNKSILEDHSSSLLSTLVIGRALFAHTTADISTIATMLLPSLPGAYVEESYREKR